MCLQNGVGDTLLAVLPALCVQFHNSTHELSTRFLAEQRRHYYVRNAPAPHA